MGLRMIHRGGSIAFELLLNERLRQDSVRLRLGTDKHLRFFFHLI
jgi:hypothetical protein